MLQPTSDWYVRVQSPMFVGRKFLFEEISFVVLISFSPAGFLTDTPIGIPD